MDANSFLNPPDEYREAPFWSWNDDLDPDELRRQIGLTKQGGWGGFFMHARTGIRTPYLGKYWMDCVKTCIEAARQHGMNAWLYDEDKWPSGFAGGLSVAENPAYRAQYLVCKVDDRPAWIAETIATFAASEVDGKLVGFRRVEKPDLNGTTDRVIQFFPQCMPLDLAFTNNYHDYPYLDVLNPEAVRAFLELTDEAYRHHFENDFGGVIPGIFTDEPGYFYGGRETKSQMAVPWTKDFSAYFQSLNGYDLLPCLPALFFDFVSGDGSSKETGEFYQIRYDFWRTMTKLFVESYTRQIGDWCAQHHLALTGHIGHEDTLLVQVRLAGAVMPHYAHMQYPGVDKLAALFDLNSGPVAHKEWIATVLAIKQVDSVACQMEKKRTICENYGCSGQDFALQGRKWIGNWAYVLGINLNTPHVALYSLRGERKRDCPPDIHYQQPWWPENRLVADYFARLSYALSQGQRVVNILVIHPVGSGWALYRPNATYEIDQLDKSLDDLLTTLMQNQRDFHLGDEMLMEPGGATPAAVTKSEDGLRIRVGAMLYRLVIVPSGVTLAGNTVRLLKEFAAAGGEILAIPPVPEFVDGRKINGPVLPENSRLVPLNFLPTVLDDVLPFDVRAASPSIWVQHRQTGGADLYFLTNVTIEDQGTVDIYLRGEGLIESWDLETGQTQPVCSEPKDGLIHLRLNFPPAGAHLLVLDRTKPRAVITSPADIVIQTIDLENDWRIQTFDLNALTLDMAEYRIGKNDPWSSPVSVLEAHAQVMKAGTGAPFALHFYCHLSEVPAGSVYLVVETPQKYQLMLNDRPVGDRDVGNWVDPSFRKLEVTGLLKPGRNVIELEGVCRLDTELESLYLIGRFGVRTCRLQRENAYMGQVFDRYSKDISITRLPVALQPDGRTGSLAVDLTGSGLPFFAGRVRLAQEVVLFAHTGKARLRLKGVHAAAIHVYVNDRHQGSAAWEPYEVDITAALRPGSNRIEIELVNSLRNLLGPHHHPGGDHAWTTPGEFMPASGWVDDYILAPFGFERAEIIGQEVKP